MANTSIYNQPTMYRLTQATKARNMKSIDFMNSLNQLQSQEKLDLTC